MNPAICSSCQKPKGTLACGLCQESVCKNCVQKMGEDAFSFLAKVPEELTHPLYCPRCYDDKVAPELAAYDEVMTLAKDVNIYFKTQGKETRTLKRKEAPVKVVDCPDYDEAILRLAFLAANAKFNALIDVQMTSKKDIQNGYQKTIWSGTGIPTNVPPGYLGAGFRDPH